MIKRRLWFIVTVMILIIPGCGVNSNLMWKSEKGVEVNSEDIPLNPEEEYKLSVDDKITFRMTTNNGAILIETMSGLTTERLIQSAPVE